MNRTTMISVLPALLMFGCGGSGTSGDMDMATAQNTSKDMAGAVNSNPDLLTAAPAPKIGTQIDRLGRPAINTALTDPFNFDTTHDATQDAYNANSDPTTWVADYAAKLAGNLAIYDSLDGTCGNQLLYMASAGTGSFLDAGYATLGTVLADDELYVNTTSGTCTGYLAVESAFVAGKAVTDCGGRGLTYDVIDTTYTVLSGAASNVSDGVGVGSGLGVVFPFLGTPN